MTKTSVFWLLFSLLTIALVTALGPAERMLGTNVRVVYLHAAWVWTSLAAFVSAGATGLVGLLTRRQTCYCWSLALGRTGFFFWITYLPLSIWAMQTNWNGLFLAEPRWRLAVIFSIVGLLLQTGLSLLDRPVWTSTTNLGFAVILIATLLNTANVMHPPAPILTSDVLSIQLYFLALLILTLLVGVQIARWWRNVDCRC